MHPKEALKCDNVPQAAVYENSDENCLLSQRITEAYGHFAETTTFGGAIHTYISPRLFWKVTWVVLVVTMVGATIWNTNQVIQDYLGFPVVTTVEIADHQSIPFPTVTLCNRNPVDCTKLAFAYMKYSEDLYALFACSGCMETMTENPLMYRLVSNFLVSFGTQKNSNVTSVY